jgi:hypothetical protein
VHKVKTQHQRLQGRLQGLREVMKRYMGTQEWVLWVVGRVCALRVQGLKVEQDEAAAAAAVVLG